MSGATSRTSAPTSRRTACRCGPSGSRPTSSSASPTTATSPTATSASSSGPRSSPGTSWARRAWSAAPPATSTARWSACRSRSRAWKARRFAIACNGHALPLQPTGTRGERVAGVRFRAWQPPACLHPTIGVHSPLRFDLVDRWSRPLAGRLHLPRHAPGRPQLRDAAGQRARGRGPPPVALRGGRPYAGADDGGRAGRSTPSSRTRWICGGSARPWTCAAACGIRCGRGDTVAPRRGCWPKPCPTRPTSTADLDRCWPATAQPRPPSTRCWRRTAASGRIGAASSTASPRMGPEGRAAAAESTRRLLRESGIAFNVYADPDDRAHAWRLDLVPVLLPDDEWERLAAGILQRARLIDAVLADLHGDAEAAAGRQPAGVAAPGQPGLRAHQRRPRGTASAASSTPMPATWRARRRASGWSWATRPTPRSATAMCWPAGWRSATAWPQLFRDCHTRRLAGYFLALQESFQGLCRRDDGRIVLLSPGPASPSYFSHAYLARYLGYTVVESGDLTVRDNQVYLKTLDGLQRVYLVVAKQPGHLMDPLHLPGTRARRHPGPGAGCAQRQRRHGQPAGQRRDPEPRPGTVRRAGCSSGCSARRRCWRTCRRAGWARPAGAPRRWTSPSAGR